MTWLFYCAGAFAPDDLPHDLTDLEMTWLPLSPGAATEQNGQTTILVQIIVNSELTNT